jgi:hypothetical protein
MQQLMSFYAPQIASIGVGQQMEANRAEALVLTPEQAMSVLQDRCKVQPLRAQDVRQALGNSVFGQYWNQTFYPNVNQPAVLPAGQVAADAYTLSRALHALGVVGTQAYTQLHNGRLYIIFKGHAGLRNVLQGTRYLASNPQILQLGLGVKGLQNVAKGGFILGLVVSAGIEILDFLFNDQKTLTQLVGSIGYEAVKSGVVAGLAYGAGVFAGTFTAIAVAPLGIVVVAALAAGYILNALDSHYQIKHQVLKTLDSLPSDIEQGIYQLNQQGQLALEQVKAEWKRKVKELEAKASSMAAETAAKAAELALQAIIQSAKNALRQFFRPGRL